MKTLTLLALASGFALASPASAAEWQLDATHSDVSFKVRHMAVSYTKGNFKAVKGTLKLDEKNIQKSRVDIEIDVASIDTDNSKRDDHLRSADFFDVAKHPKMRFVSTRVRKVKGGLKIDGKLSLHGVTKSVTLDVDDVSASVKGPYGFIRKGFTATATLDRRDFGLTWSQTLETGGLVVGHEIKIALEAEFMRKPKKDKA